MVNTIITFKFWVMYVSLPLLYNCRWTCFIVISHPQTYIIFSNDECKWHINAMFQYGLHIANYQFMAYYDTNTLDINFKKQI
jgi:hypothetical protein